MYDFNGFGMRMQKLRKVKGMTQEDLADRVGVSGQAVSKWENDQSYPDITLIPTLAGILGTDIEHLFGKKVETPAIAPFFPQVAKFPESIDGLPLVHNYRDVVCYSDKEVISKDETGVKFADGSTAELTNTLAVNKGKGEIKFYIAEEMPLHAEPGFDPSATPKFFEFFHSHSIHAKIYNCVCQIVRSPDDRTRVRAKGTAEFLHRLEVRCINEERLEIDYRQPENSNNNRSGNYKENQLVVELPFDEGRNQMLSINGNGEIMSEIKKFDTGNITVNGSGTINVQSFNRCDLAVNGSGDINGVDSHESSVLINGSGNVTWARSEHVNMMINGSGCIDLVNAKAIGLGIHGSGDIRVGTMTGGGNFSANVNGSSFTTIQGGICDNFDVKIAGSGDIAASGLTACNAKIEFEKDSCGEVTLGRVIESSTEKVSKNSKITILNRGAE